MWKVLPTYTRRLVYNRQIFAGLQFRSFLSESFQLENAWKDRLQSPIINKIKINDMFYELDNQFNHFGYASALDVDLFVNAVNNGTSFDELEDLVHRLRLSPEAVNILPSTQHAIIRLYLKWDKIDDLMRILDDRLNYGVFPDDYCSLLLLNTFIKEGNFRDAAKISNLGMLQEDVSNDLIKYMSLYACHKYLENPVPWVKEIDKEQSVDDEKEEDDEEEEVVKIRVKYSRNPYFDDHFDLVDPKHLIGKTLHFIGSELDDTAGRTYKLIGLLLHDKLEQAKIYIETLSRSEENNVVFKDGLNIATDLLNEKSLLEGKDASYSVLVNELKDLLNNSFSSSQLAVDESLLSIVENRLKDLINKNETIEINKQLQVERWLSRNVPPDSLKGGL